MHIKFFSFCRFYIFLSDNRFRFAVQTANVRGENLKLTSPETEKSAFLGKQLFLNPLQEYEPHTLVGSYYSFKNNLTATLMLNNKGELPLQVTPIFYSSDGTQLQLAPLNMNGASYAEFDLSEILANAGEEFQEGNLQMSYQGSEMQLGSQIKIIDTNNSLIWEEQFFEPAAKYTSLRLEGVWWMPSNNCETKFILTNTTDAPVTATITVDGTSPGQQTPGGDSIKRAQNPCFGCNP